MLEKKRIFFFCLPEEQGFSLVLTMSSCFVATWCSDTDGGMGGVVCDHGVLTVFKIPEQEPAGSRRGGQHQSLQEGDCASHTALERETEKSQRRKIMRIEE